MKTLNKGSVLGALALGALTLGGMSGAHANTSDAMATQALTSQVYTQVSNNDYAKENGGFTKGSQLLVQDANGIYQINEAEYERLSIQGRNALVSDIHDATTEAKETGAESGITENTVSNWYKSLQNTNGLGSQLLVKMMEVTKPDLNKGFEIYKPFSGPISILAGFLAILLFGLLGLTVVLDLLYIVIPMVRLAFGDGSDSSGNSKAQKMGKIISHAARSAVEAEEGGGSGSGGSGEGKSAIWIYFKKTFVKYLLVGLALVYLVSGQLWIFVGWMLDLVGRTLNF